LSTLHMPLGIQNSLIAALRSALVPLARTCRVNDHSYSVLRLKLLIITAGRGLENRLDAVISDLEDIRSLDSNVD
jgi:hypothetical protein